jgi:outer membrane protein assembly factor BamB
MLSASQRLCGSIVVVLFIVGAVRADWLAFRGDGTSTAPSERPPVKWNVESGENVGWKIPLAGKGVSGPIVVGDNVILTASSGPRESRLHVSCFDSTTGNERWTRQFWATGSTLCNPMTAVACNTPASDGQLVFAQFSSNDLVCLDLAGNLVWFRGLNFDYPAARNDTGMAASPAVIGDTVVVQIECQGDSFAAGLNKFTGQDRWRIPRAPKPNWSSPVVLRGDGKKAAGDIVLLQSADELTAHEPATGKLLWKLDSGGDAITSSVAADDLLFVPTNGIRAVRIPRESAAAETAWTAPRLGFGAASPVLHEDRIYTVNRAGVLNCGSTADGKLLWQLRLKGAFWATPVLAGEHLYLVNQDGLVHVVKLHGDKQGELVAENDLGEKVLASPALSGNAIYYRTEKHLWKIGGGG